MIDDGICNVCSVPLETELEFETRLCDGCAIDMYEEIMRKREQAYLEDDSNFQDGE